MIDPMELIFVGIFGLLVGAVVSVVSVKIPQNMQRNTENFVALFSGNSPEHDIAPVFSPKSLTQLFPLSLRTIVICAACVFLTIAAIAFFGVTQRGLAVLCFSYLAATLFAIDVEAKLLPDNLTYSLLWLGLLVNIEQTFCSVDSAIIGAVAGYLILWTLEFSFKNVTKMDGMGNGDFKFMAALGAWHGYQIVFGLLIFSFTLSFAAWLIRTLFCSGREQQSLAFGPYLAVAGIAAFYCDAFKTPYLLGI